MKYGYFFALLCVGLICSCTSETVSESDSGAGQEAQLVDGDNVVKGWIRIKLAQDGTRELRSGSFTRGEADSGYPQLDELASALGATEIRRVFSDGGRFAERRRRYGLHLWYDVRFDDNVPVSRAGEGFASLEGIEHVEPIFKKRLLDEGGIPGDALYVPVAISGEEMPFNDPLLSKQWHYYNDGSISGTTAGSDMNLFEGWKTTTGDPAVIVAVIDSGVQYDHEDLAANMWINEAELNGTEGVDDDGNGYIDDIYGWNFVSKSGTIVPEKHGTHVAGTVAAVNNNGTGVCGVAGGSGNGDGARLMTLQVFEGKDSVENTDADAVIYAADNGAVIMQNSWTFSSSKVVPAAYDVAFDYFIENAGMDDTDGDGINDTQTGPMKGGILICATGNSGSFVEAPACDPRSVAVTAMGTDFNMEPYSNRGKEAGIMAPGGVKAAGDSRRIWSTDVNNGYVAMFGTSMACPHVSGVAALIISKYGAGREGFTAEECREILLRAYKPAGDGVEDKFKNHIGVGILDAGAAFDEDPEAEPGKAEFGEASFSGKSMNVPLVVPADGNGNAVADFVITYGISGSGETKNKTMRNFYDVGDIASFTFEVEYNTDYVINVISVDRFGNRSQEASVSVTSGSMENRPPERTSRKFTDVTMQDTSPDSVTQLALREYFTDPDIEYGDVLSYSAVSSEENIAGVTVTGDVLILTPLAKGTSLIEITVTDLAGASVQASFYATVKQADTAGPGDGGFVIYPNPAADKVRLQLGGMTGRVSVRIYDTAARKVMDTAADIASGTAELEVAGLSPGVYSLVAESGGKRFKGSFVKK